MTLETEIYQILKKHRLSLKKREEVIVDLLDFINKREKQLTLTDVVKSLPQDNYCNVCNLPSDGEKCYSKRCPV